MKHFWENYLLIFKCLFINRLIDILKNQHINREIGRLAYKQSENVKKCAKLDVNVCVFFDSLLFSLLHGISIIHHMYCIYIL